MYQPVGSMPVPPSSDGAFHLDGAGRYQITVAFGSCTRAALDSDDKRVVDLFDPVTTVDLSEGGRWRPIGYREDPTTHSLRVCSLVSVVMRKV